VIGISCWRRRKDGGYPDLARRLLVKRGYLISATPTVLTHDPSDDRVNWTRGVGSREGEGGDTEGDHEVSDNVEAI
jgi:hypothetical protein